MVLEVQQYGDNLTLLVLVSPKALSWVKMEFKSSKIDFDAVSKPSHVNAKKSYLHFCHFAGEVNFVFQFPIPSIDFQVFLLLQNKSPLN